MIYFGKKKILKTNIDLCDYDFVVSKIIESDRKNKKLLVFPLATHTLVAAYFNKKLQKILDSYSILTPDSQWVKWSFNWIYGINLKERVYGPDLMIRVLEKAEKNKITVFLYGTNLVTLRKLRHEIKKKNPKIQLIFEPAPYKKLSLKEQKELIKKINKNRAKIIFIALSSPDQVMLAKGLSDLNTKNSIFIPVGAAFDFLSKVKKQAPKWMRNTGLEWLYRLINEPTRLWKRYLIYGVSFFVLIFFQKIKMFINNKNQ